jgi:hypothetical protein
MIYLAFYTLRARPPCPAPLYSECSRLSSAGLDWEGRHTGLIGVYIASMIGGRLPDMPRRVKHV